MPIEMKRRAFLTGLGSALLVAPAIVHSFNIMPVKAIRLPSEFELEMLAAARELGADDRFQVEDLRAEADRWFLKMRANALANPRPHEPVFQRLALQEGPVGYAG